MKNYIIICFLLFTKAATGQYYVFGSDTESPIGAVNIYFSENMGVITNDDGYFELPDNIAIDTLHISHLSYKSQKMLLDGLKKNDTIFLNNAPIELDEVILSSIDPKNIVLKAIKKIDENYIIPYNSYGFYRQSLQEDKIGVEMIEVEFIGYIENKSVSTKITNARRTENFSKLGIKTHGGVSTTLEEGDFVRNKAHFLDINKIEEYTYKYEGQIEHNGLRVYRIGFAPSDKDNIQILRQGELYIDSGSFAITEVRYTFDKKKLSEISKLSEKNISTKEPFYRLNDIQNVIRYKQLPNKKWYLFYLEAYNLREGVFQGESHDYDLTAKLVINNIKTQNVEKVKTNYNLSKDFSRAVRRFDNLEQWNDTYKLSLSGAEKKILQDIKNKQRNDD